MLLQVHYCVPKTVMIEVDGARHHFYGVDRTGLRRSRPLLVDEATWSALQATPQVQAMLAKGQITGEVRR